MAITLRACGAARTVTGLSLLFETPRTRFLVDCGMFQGPKSLKALNWEPFPYAPRDIDAVLLTHAHIDHSGLLPRLVKEGFRGPIHATGATMDLCSIMLPDSGHVQEMEVETLNRRNRRRGLADVTPIYTANDAVAALRAFRAVPFDRWMEVLPGVRARWWNAGHMLGSASIEIEVAEADEEPVRVLVSGDLGPDCTAFHRDPEGPGDLDHVVLESTYGDEEKPCVGHEERRERLAALVRDAHDPAGALLVPAFAVERTQEICWDLVTLMQAGRIPQAPIFVDSPLAIRATEVFADHAQDLEQGGAVKRALRSPLLHFTESGDQSRRIAEVEGFHIIVAGSGMCDAGRIRHHLKRWLWSPAATVLLTGYQAEGTLGRLLQDGRREVRIQGDTIRVAATIGQIRDYSGHADATELTAWLKARGRVRGGVFLVHGEPPAMDALAARILAEGMARPGQVILPALDDAFLLRAGAVPEPRQAAHRRADPAAAGRPDWHNARAALLLGIEDAIERAPDAAARDALIGALRRVVDAARGG
ncbi:MBL fold metallo-hydrolase RNA specificity domain-containing protein [Roseomonas fluvialis]|uniref:MBL fold metallo-hydrolase n=1 Tax=Roseomonas fluvialis TaxID=1750527 RepID=A0ABN6P0U5_9PROT|nr:MBL fold metallo-hydrolase [Roseomonas fluvialis]BDG71254.1 MBL fold metallo-hydrolase [Roseomonas fluvialis]